MDHDELGYTDFIAMDARQPSASHDVARTIDFAALADAERADAEAFRLV
jgi:hypothetical protein